MDGFAISSRRNALIFAENVIYRGPSNKDPRRSRSGAYFFGSFPRKPLLRERVVPRVSCGRKSASTCEEEHHQEGRRQFPGVVAAVAERRTSGHHGQG